MGVTKTKESLYKRTYFDQITKLQNHAKPSYEAFLNFNQEVFKESHLTTKLKELIAVAVAHVTGCAYCIDIHTKAAKKEGVTKGELSEAIFVATALKAGSAFAHGANAIRSYDDEAEDELYKGSYFSKVNQLSASQPDTFQAFITFTNQALKEGALTVLEKEFIAVAVAHVTGCAYCIDIHTKAAKKEDATKEQLTEVIFVATALKAGSAFAHGVNAINAFEAD